MSQQPPIVPAIRSTLVQYAEVWDVAEDGHSIRLQQCGRFRDNGVDTSHSGSCLRSGEGLAGMAWNQRRAIILQESPSELLQRIGTMNGLDLAALIAYPVMRGQSVLSVVVLGIGNGPGAFEVWSRDDRDELSVSASYYSGLKRFEFISRHVRFPKGAGLPGAAWKTGLPHLASDLRNSDRFMRSFAADETELNTGLGLPVGSAAGHSDSILLLLSSHCKPIARAFEIWQPAKMTGTSVALQCSASDWSAAESDQTLPKNPDDSDAVVAAVWNSGRPQFTTNVDSCLSIQTEQVKSIAVRAVLAVPIYRGPEQIAVVVMVF